MRYLFLFFPFLMNAQALQLALPQVRFASAFFLKEIPVSMAFDMVGARVYFSYDETPTIKSPAYYKPLILKKSTTIKAIAIHPDFLPSEVLERQFIRVNHIPKSINLRTKPHKDYAGRSAESLFDLKKGSANFSDGNWLGFLGDTVVFESKFKKNLRCKRLIISTLSDIKSWILPMRTVKVFGKNERGEWQQIGFWQAPSDDIVLAEPLRYGYFVTIELQKLKTQEIRVEVLPFGNFPQGHAGAGTPAWLFLDEVVFE